MNLKSAGPGRYNLPKHFGRIDITKVVDGEEMLYLRRWYLFRCKAFSVRLHHIVMEDVDRWPHDHPWPFVALILWGGYDEKWGPEGTVVPAMVKRVRFANFHHATDVHKITRFYRAEKGAWTLCLTGKESRRWGFTTPEGWVWWSDAIDRGIV